MHRMSEKVEVFLKLKRKIASVWKAVALHNVKSDRVHARKRPFAREAKQKYPRIYVVPHLKRSGTKVRRLKRVFFYGLSYWPLESTFQKVSL